MLCFQNLPKSTGFLDATIAYVQNLRRQLSSFPVIPWPRFVQLVRSEVNPLAGETHCRQLIQQLQLIGEVGAASSAPFCCESEPIEVAFRLSI